MPSRTWVGNDAPVTSTPWPMRVGSLLLREATAADIEQLLSPPQRPRGQPLHAPHQRRTRTFRQDWLAVPTSDSDFSCVAEVDGTIVAMGFLDIVDGMGQPGKPTAPRESSGTSFIRTSRAGALPALWPAASAAAFGPLGLRRVTASATPTIRPRYGYWRRQA